MVTNIAVLLIVVIAATAATASDPTHVRELRGAWIASVDHIDWPPAAGLSVADQQSSLLAMINQAVRLRFNAIYFQVRPEGDALYVSSLEPWSRWLTGAQGTPPSPMWDPLQFAIEACHERSIELHAWLNPYRSKMDRKSVLAPLHVCYRHPEVCYEYGDNQWMDPGSQVVQDNTYNVVLDIIKRYDVDGIHFDDYFYPYPVSGQYFPDNKTYAAYVSKGGQLSVADWRRDNVNQLIQRINNRPQRVPVPAKFGISPFGIWKPGYPPTIAGLSSYDALYADSRLWLSQAWIDYLAPQLYWQITSANQSFPLLLQWWISVANSTTSRFPRHVYSGNAQYRSPPWPLTELSQQVAIVRQHTADNTGIGCIFFSYASFSPKLHPDVEPYYSTVIYPSQALPPVMAWLPSTTPSMTSSFTYDASNKRLVWSNVASIRSWIIYLRSAASSTWLVGVILPSSSTSWLLPTSVTKGDQFAIRAVSPIAVEGPANYVTIQR